MKKSRLIVLCPHPDDEIFTFPFINNFSKDEYEISALFLTGSSIRRKEAKRSCGLLKWQSLFALDFGITFQDSCLHEQSKELERIIKIIFDNYDLVLCPLLEGGHHDHDTISLITICLALKKNIKNLYFYPTYTAYGEMGFFSVMSENNYCNLFLKRNINLRFSPFKSLFHMFVIYKSQLKSWLFLVIPYLFNIFKNNSYTIYTLNYCKFYNYKDVMNSLRGEPLYEIHKRLTQNEWKSYFL